MAETDSKTVILNNSILVTDKKSSKIKAIRISSDLGATDGPHHIIGEVEFPQTHRGINIKSQVSHNAANICNIKVEVLDKKKKVLDFVSYSLNDFLVHRGHLLKELTKVGLEVEVSALVIEETNCFTEFAKYMNGGLHIDSLLIIDYSNSQGEEKDPNYHHWIKYESFNPFQIALLYCSKILIDFDGDHKLNILGFGGKVTLEAGVKDPGYVRVTNPKIKGKSTISDIFELEEAYRNTLKQIKPSGQFKLAPFLETVNRKTKLRTAKNPYRYNVICLLVQREFDDMEEAKEHLVNLSMNACSFIFVGVGDGPFERLKEFDDYLKSSAGHHSWRDFVQFVHIDNFYGKDKYFFYKHLMFELPQQVVHYMKLKGIEPMKEKDVEGLFPNKRVIELIEEMETLPPIEEELVY